MLTGTKPDSKGKEAVLYRSRQLTEFQWTPVGDIPVYTKATGKTKLPAGEPQLGMLYSSPEPTDKFIFENVSFETFLSILANPDSALYNKDLNGHNNSWAYFGLVCNGLARYAFNIRRRFSTKRWPTVPGMEKVADDGAYTPEQIQLCDVLYAHGKGRSHVAMVTDILRDEDGVIRQIEVSEAVRPVCERKQYDLDVFFEKFKLFALWRYAYVDSVPMPDPWQDQCLQRGVPGLPVIALDYGNKTNYRTSEEVVISAFPEGENQLQICRGETVLETLTISGRGKAVRRFDRGYYQVKHLGTGETLEFCVTEPKIDYRVEDGKLTVWADSQDPESKILYMDFREKSRGSTLGADGKTSGYSNVCASLAKLEELEEAEKESGVITRQIPEDAANFKVYFENKYGVWTHQMFPL